MLKKVLFVAISLLVGMLILSQSMYSNFYKVFQLQTREAVQKGNYSDAERYFSFVISEENKISFKVPDSDVVIEIYASMSQNIRQYEIKDKKKAQETNEPTVEGTPEKTPDEKKKMGQFTTLESGLQISLFNLPKDFQLSDTVSDKDKGIEAYKGGVTLNFSDGVSQKYEFNNEETNLNYYAYNDFYSFMPMTVYYDDYKNNVNKTTGTLESFTITDGSGKVSYEVKNTTGISFENTLYTTFEEKMNEYNKIQAVVKDNKEVDDKALKKCFNAINDMVVAKDSGFIAQHAVGIIYKSGSFIWRMALSAGFFLLVDGLLGFLLFRKKKNKVVPYNKNIRPANKPVESDHKNVVNVPSNPESFNRKDLFGEDDKKALVEKIHAENEAKVENVDEPVASNENAEKLDEPVVSNEDSIEENTKETK